MLENVKTFYWKTAKISCQVIYIYSEYRDPLINRTASIPESPLYRNPLYTRIPSIPESPLYQNPLYTRIPSIPEYQLHQSPSILETPLNQPPLYRNPLYIKHGLWSQNPLKLTSSLPQHSVWSLGGLF